MQLHDQLLKPAGDNRHIEVAGGKKLLSNGDGENLDSRSLQEVCKKSKDHILILISFMHFAMEVNDTNMMIFVAFAFMSILVLLVFYACIAKRPRGFTNCQPTPEPVVHSHNFPPGTRQQNNRRNSLNLTVCTHNQRRPEENDERFCQTVGTLENKKFDRLIKT